VSRGRQAKCIGEWLRTDKGYNRGPLCLTCVHAREQTKSLDHRCSFLEKRGQVGGTRTGEGWKGDGGNILLKDVVQEKKLNLRSFISFSHRTGGKCHKERKNNAEKEVIHKEISFLQYRESARYETFWANGFHNA